MLFDWSLDFHANAAQDDFVVVRAAMGSGALGRTPPAARASHVDAADADAGTCEEEAARTIAGDMRVLLRGEPRVDRELPPSAEQLWPLSEWPLAAAVRR